MRGRFFLDTNVFVYTLDKTAPTKRRLATRLVDEALTTGRGSASWQVVQEFINVATRKFLKPLSLSDCAQYVRRVLEPLCKVYPSTELYLRGLALSEQTGFPFYDSLIVQSAIETQATVLYTEDLQHGRVVHGVELVNPFV